MSSGRGLPKGLKDPITIGLRNTRACVRNREPNLILMNFGFHRHCSTFRCELIALSMRFVKTCNRRSRSTIYSGATFDVALDMNRFRFCLNSRQLTDFFCQLLPAWSSTNYLTIVNPTPMPPCYRAYEASACWKRSKMNRRNSGSISSPASDTWS